MIFLLVKFKVCMYYYKMGKSIVKIILKAMFFIVTFSTMILMEQFSMSLIVTFLSHDLKNTVKCYKN